MEKQNLLFDAIRNEDLASFKEILEQNPELIDVKDSRGSTPLLLATYYNNEAITDYLLSKNPDIDAKDASGNTALMGVCFKGYENIAKKLIKNGADVNAVNYGKATPLIYAASFNRAGLIKLLLKNGADKTLTDSRGNSARQHAKMQGLTEIADILDKA